MKKIKFIFPVLLFAIFVYAVWTRSGKWSDSNPGSPRYVLGNVEEIGTNHGRGNVIALSPFLHTYDYTSSNAFYKMLYYYFSVAKRQQLLGDSTIVILPEYLGSWLVAAYEKKSVYTDASIAHAMKTIVRTHPLAFASSWLRSHSTDRTTEATFRMKAGTMLEIYQQSFQKLAKEFKVTIVAGSIVLPDPYVKNGQITINEKGKLYNVTAIFKPDGNVYPMLTKKIFLVNEEKTFTSCAPQKTIPIYKTVAGNLAVFICADAWYPEIYKTVKANTSIIAIPSFISGNDSWDKPWKGYNGAQTPASVNKNDIGHLTEREAWIRYAMFDTATPLAVNVFLRGDLWNIGTDGYTILRRKQYITESREPAQNTGALINVWLE